MTQHITVPLPDGVAPSVARRIAVETEAVVNRRTGALVEAQITDLMLTDQERRAIRSAIDCATQAAEYVGLSDLLNAAVLTELRHRIDPDSRDTIVARVLQEPNEFHRESRA